MPDDDDFPIFRPRMGRRVRPAWGPATSFRHVLLSQIRGAGRLGARRHAARSRLGVERPGADARRVVVKAHVVRLTPTGAKAASLHLRYVQRDGVEKDGSKGLLYDAKGAAQADVFEQPRMAEKHQFRLIVSPEDAGELDLTEYVRRWMARVERDVGRKLEWAAVNHFNTEHPHAHVILRGVDREGREVRLDRGYIANGLRWRAQEIATEELGLRPERAIRRAHEKEVTQERFTSLDRELERRLQEGRVEMLSGRRGGRIDEGTLVARLEYLAQMRLAERLSTREWRLTAGWHEHLRALGMRGDILKQIHMAISGDPARYHAVRVGEPLPTGETGAPAITGRVAHKGLSDELKGAFYAIIETPTGHAYHVPLDARSAEALRPGAIVSLTSALEPAVRGVDRHIAEVARSRGGVYELEQDTTPEARRVRARMRELERLGLVADAGGNRWTVVSNLLEELELHHQRTPPRYQLRINPQALSVHEQIHYRGPVWLDRIDRAALAPYGLGADVHCAMEKRRDVLRGFGIAPGDPSRTTQLRELERNTVGEEIAARSGQVFVRSAPDGLRGRVGICSAPMGTSYTIVSDDSRFAVLSTTRALRALEGKSVILSSDAKGQAIARPAPDRDLGR